ncbi:MAG TPA: hypothetical protein VLM79_32010 [Kofleriaceae bacterium]|nr:hypothetical protein [Kofleriaceae bacterium]
MSSSSNGDTTAQTSDVPRRRSLLAPVDDSQPDRAALLEAERMAIADAERPGSWFGEDGADGRMLTQEATDMLIRDELWREVAPTTPPAEREELLGILGVPQVVLLPSPLQPTVFDQADDSLVHPGSALDPDLTDRFHVANVQRGGIDSDPLVRLLAFRAWGHRDRRWFEDRGVRQGEPVSDPNFWHEPDASPVITLARPGELVLGNAKHNARPGQELQITSLARHREHRGRYNRQSFLVGDRPRIERPLARPPGPPSPFEALMCEVFGFDHLSREYSHTKRWTLLVAERDGYRTATRVSDARLARAPDALRHHACRTLAIELRRLGATNIRLGDPFDALARRLGVPPIVPPIVEQSDPAVAATLFIDYHDLIETGLARSTPSDVAHALAVTAPMPHDDALQLIAMATIAKSRVDEEILRSRPHEWSDADVTVEVSP